MTDEAPASAVDAGALLLVLERRPMDAEELGRAFGAPPEGLEVVLQGLVRDGHAYDWGGVYVVSWRALARRHRRTLVAWALMAAGLAAWTVALFEVTREDTPVWALGPGVALLAAGVTIGLQRRPTRA